MTPPVSWWTVALLAVAVGVVAFALGYITRAVRAAADLAARQHSTEVLATAQHGELVRLRRQRRDALVVLDRASAGEFGMLGLAPVSECRAALGVPPAVSDRRTRDTFGRGNDIARDLADEP